MNRFVVAAGFRWDEYPGLRPGRIYAGAPDVSRSPLGESHLVDGADAEQTLCGLPRASFPHDFPGLAQLTAPDQCPTCRTAAPF
jgi:hypothetical protein